MTAGERLTIAVFTLRPIRDGEELTFDYSSVTESEKEFKAAVCLCGTTACRGSFLYFAGSKAFMQVRIPEPPSYLCMQYRPLCCVVSLRGLEPGTGREKVGVAFVL